MTDISEEYTAPIVGVDEYSFCCLFAWFLKLEAVHFFKLSVNVYHSTWHHIPKDSTLHSRWLVRDDVSPNLKLYTHPFKEF
jgi:hypothetical protein